MSVTSYADRYRNIDFRKNPEKYCIGRGEQGVLIAEPYKSEILPYWRFKTPEIAQNSAEKIYDLFLAYKNENDFVGMDMARKFLQMGFTRARRYANHSDGRKFKEGILIPQDGNSENSLKAESAKIFYEFYMKAKDDLVYKKWAKKHRALEAKQRFFTENDDI